MIFMENAQILPHFPVDKPNVREIIERHSLQYDLILYNVVKTGEKKKRKKRGYR